MRYFALNFGNYNNTVVSSGLLRVTGNCFMPEVIRKKWLGNICLRMICVLKLNARLLDVFIIVLIYLSIIYNFEENCQSISNIFIFVIFVFIIPKLNRFKYWIRIITKSEKQWKITLYILFINLMNILFLRYKINLINVM